MFEMFIRDATLNSKRAGTARNILHRRASSKWPSSATYEKQQHHDHHAQRDPPCRSEALADVDAIDGIRGARG